MASPCKLKPFAFLNYGKGSSKNGYYNAYEKKDFACLTLLLVIIDNGLCLKAFFDIAPLAKYLSKYSNCFKPNPKLRKSPVVNPNNQIHEKHTNDQNLSSLVVDAILTPSSSRMHAKSKSTLDTNMNTRA